MMLCFFFKQKTAYEMRISDWSSDVCSSDLFDNSAMGQATNTKRDVEAQRAGGNCLDLHLVAASQLHGGAFAKSALNLRQRGFESFLSIHIPFFVLGIDKFALCSNSPVPSSVDRAFQSTLQQHVPHLFLSKHTRTNFYHTQHDPARPIYKFPQV